MDSWRAAQEAAAGVHADFESEFIYDTFNDARASQVLRNFLNKSIWLLNSTELIMIWSNRFFLCFPMNIFATTSLDSGIWVFGRLLVLTYGR